VRKSTLIIRKIITPYCNRFCELKTDAKQLDCGIAEGYQQLNFAPDLFNIF
jgi:hypothetical protein